MAVMAASVHTGTWPENVEAPLPKTGLCHLKSEAQAGTNSYIGQSPRTNSSHSPSLLKNTHV